MVAFISLSSAAFYDARLDQPKLRAGTERDPEVVVSHSGRAIHAHARAGGAGGGAGGGRTRALRGDDARAVYATRELDE